MSWIVVMDKPGKSAAKTFYRRLEKLKGCIRIQQSVYLVNGPETIRALVDLAEEHGFEVRVFRAEEIWDRQRRGSLRP